MQPDPAFGTVFTALSVLALFYYVAFIFRTTFVIDGVRYFSLFDDAMISMRYARNLAHGHGLTFNPGEPPVEGFTNPLWVLVMTGVHLLPVAGRHASGVMQALGAALLLVHLDFVRRLAALLPGATRGTVFAAVALTAFHYPLVNWTLQGMEVGLLALIATASGWMLLAGRPPWRAYVLLAAGTLVRLDFAVVLLAYCAASAAADPGRRGTHLRWGLAAALVALAAQTLARRLYFGEFLPLTYHLKLTGYPLGLRVARGAWVLLTFLARAWGAPVLLAAAAVNAARGAFGRVAPLLAVFAAQCLYSVWVGGDAWEEQGICNRYVTVAMPLLLVVGSWGVARAAGAWQAGRGPSRARGTGRAGMGWIAPVALAATLAALSPWQRLTLLLPPPYVKEDSIFVAKALAARAVTLPGASVAAAGIGATGYYADRRVVDLLGKCDPYVARLPMHVAASGNPFTQFWPGHLKWDCRHSIGDLKPDVVTQLWNFPEEARPYLEADYVLARVDFADTSWAMALRAGSPRVRWDAVTEIKRPRPGHAPKWRLLGWRPAVRGPGPRRSA
ncbi:MAG: hypothetical protein HZB25_09765 [Candidatus Eisenbacteria bacterium]|nr:hypothetical protein [Candidatus Eisenbacteria bacterium]